MNAPIRLATRRSPLAMAQAEIARQALLRAVPGRPVELLPMTTTGDERQQWSLAEKGGKGLFTSELERALVAGEADYAVHSGKDLPTEMNDGTEIVGFLPREDPRDVLVLREDLEGAPASIATGSPRRRDQLALRFRDVEWMEIRGSVETRLRKILEGYADATVLAAAGLNRLGIRARKGLRFEPLSVEDSVPAAAQGAIAIQGREGEGLPWAECLCLETTAAVALERRALRALGGGCHSATAAHVSGSVLYLFDASFGRHSLPLTETNVDLDAWIAELRRNEDPA